MQKMKFSRKSLEEFYIKWFSGPSKDPDVVREIGHTIDAMRLERPNFKRFFARWSDAIDTIFEYLYTENIYISVAFYRDKTPYYHYLFYDFDSREDPNKAIEKALEFAGSLRKRFGVDPIPIRSGFKGMHIVVVLSRPIDFDTYRYIWRYLIQPYRLKGYIDDEIVDDQILFSRAMERIPYTYNIKFIDNKVVRNMCYIIDRNGDPIDPKDFDWSLYTPLDPSRIPIVKVSFETIEVRRVGEDERDKNKPNLPEDPAELDNNEAVPPCIRNILSTLKTSGDPDHFQRMVLVLYLKWIGYDKERVIELFKKYAKDYNEKMTRYQVEFIYGERGSKKDYLSPSCNWMKQHSLCLECNWNRNIATYTYTRAYIPNNIKEKFFSKVKEHS